MKKYKTLKSKKEQPQGFTLIEVTLFLALTGLVLAGIISTFSSISRQRYNDAVQNFAEYLRGIYSRVENVQNNGFNCGCTGAKNTCCGQGKVAFYGRLATFTTENNKQVIKSYDVIGNAHLNSDLTDTKQALSGEVEVDGRIRDGVSIRFINGDQGELYNTIWQTVIQKPNKSNFTGSILVVRSPSSGIIHTYYSNTPIDSSGNLVNWLKNANEEDINFCVYSDDYTENFIRLGGKRRNIRIIPDAHNASGVELISNDIPRDDGGSVCD